jgi:hypothetical protein
VALSRPKHGFESRWGRHYFLAFFAALALLVRPFEQSAIVTVKGVLRTHILEATVAVGDVVGWWFKVMPVNSLSNRVGPEKL